MIHYHDFESLAPKHEIEFMSKNKPPTQPPNPEFPNGLTLIDPTLKDGDSCCHVQLPYPAACIGTWLVKCRQCGRNIACTAAGRPDDPRLIVMRCKNQPNKGTNGQSKE